ncbi:hypothetical protein [Bordetella tumulicola]|uniref:hypothetical protein n=1 Tax=Bordetella tumulicola TaxID=1649133 RepID=UPI0039F0DFB7
MSWAKILPLLIAVSPSLLMISSRSASAGPLLFPQSLAGTRPHTAAYTPYNTVTFGNLTLPFAVLAWLSVGRQLTRRRRTETVSKLVAQAYPRHRESY